MLDCSSKTDEPDLDFARRLAVDVGVAAIPPSVIYHKQNDYKIYGSVFQRRMRHLKRLRRSFVLCRLNRSVLILRMENNQCLVGAAFQPRQPTLESPKRGWKTAPTTMQGDTGMFNVS